MKNLAHKNKIFRNSLTAVLASVFIAISFLAPLHQANAAACSPPWDSTVPLGDTHIAPTTIPKATDKININFKFTVTCNISRPTGWKIRLLRSDGPAKGTRLTKTIKEWGITAWTKSTIQSDGRYLNEGTVTDTVAAFSDTPTNGEYEFAMASISPTGANIVDPGRFTASFTGGAAAPPNNTPGNTNGQTNGPVNTCTGTGCGDTTGSDFDLNVAQFVNPININSFPELVLYVMRGLIFLIGIMAVLIIIIGGVRMVISQGNQESVTKGKQTIIWAVAGLIVALLSFSLVSIVQNLLSKP
jgi:hypothetical protein